MTKTSIRQSNKKQRMDDALAKPTPPEEIKNILKEQAKTNYDPRYLLQKAGKTFADFLAAPKLNKELATQFQRELEAAMPIVALDTHYLVAETVGDHYRSFVVQFANDLITEYQCDTPSEKALAENIAGAYGRTLELSRRIYAAVNVDLISNENNCYYNMLSRELEHAQRQFLSSLLVLKQLKSPNMEVNIKAKTAFISQNQQINANTQQNPTSPDSSSFNV